MKEARFITWFLIILSLIFIVGTRIMDNFPDFSKSTLENILLAGFLISTTSGFFGIYLRKSITGKFAIAYAVIMLLFCAFLLFEPADEIEPPVIMLDNKPSQSYQTIETGTTKNKVTDTTNKEKDGQGN